MTGDHVLDNAVWHSLTTFHRGLGEGNGRARRYRHDVSVFAAVDELDDASWAELGEVIGPDATVALFRAEVGPAPQGWVEHVRGEGHQMVLAEAAWSAQARPAIRPLTDDDVPAMLKLVELAQPGPFLPRTIELGGYVGVVEDGRLLAMAGERFHLPGWTEISAVCTHPDACGRGLGAAVTTHVADAITARGEHPFLHVAVGNDNARRLYEQLGFTTRRLTQFAAVSPPGLADLPADLPPDADADATAAREP